MLFSRRLVASRPGGALVVIGVTAPEAGPQAIHISGQEAVAALRSVDHASHLADWLSRQLPDEATLAATTVLVLPGRTASWNLDSGVAILRGIAPHVGTAILAAPISAHTLTSDDLLRQVGAAGLAPTFSGLISADDSLAPGSPAVIIDNTVADPPLAKVLLIVVNEHADETADRLIADAVADGCSVAILDLANSDQPRIDRWRELGVLGAAQCSDAADVRESIVALTGRIEADWYVVQTSRQRLIGPWEGVGLRETLSRFGAAGWNAAGRTVIHAAPEQPVAPDRDPYRVLASWKFGVTNRELTGAVAIRPARARSVTPVPDPWVFDHAGYAVSPFNLVVVDIEEPILDGDAPPLPRRRPWPGQPDTAQFLIEHLSGYGAFSRTYPNPPKITWWAEESVLTWGGTILRLGIGRTPRPDPLNPVYGQCLIRWDLGEDPVAELWLSPSDGPDEFGGRGSKGTILVDMVRPNVEYVARLYGDDRRSMKIGEVRFGFRCEIPS